MKGCVAVAHLPSPPLLGTCYLLVFFCKEDDFIQNAAGGYRKAKNVHYASTN
jgi:hypothetical protein